MVLCKNCKHIIKSFAGQKFAKCGIKRKSFIGDDTFNFEYCDFANRIGTCKEFEPKKITIWQRIKEII